MHGPRHRQSRLPPRTRLALTADEKLAHRIHAASPNTPATRAIMASGRAPSQTPVPTTETGDLPVHDGAKSTLTEEEWKAMSNALTNVYAYRTEE